MADIFLQRKVYVHGCQNPESFYCTGVSLISPATAPISLFYRGPSWIIYDLRMQINMQIFLLNWYLEQAWAQLQQVLPKQAHRRSLISGYDEVRVQLQSSIHNAGTSMGTGTCRETHQTLLKNSPEKSCPHLRLTVNMVAVMLRSLQH